MRKVMISIPGHTTEMLFDPNSRDNCAEPFIYLRDFLAERGMELLGMDRISMDEADVLLLWDYPHGVLPEGKKKIMVLCEPPAVRTDTWVKGVWNRYDVVLTWDDSMVDGKRFRKYCYPIPATEPTIETAAWDEKRLLVGIFANKASIHPAELYSNRLRTITKLKELYPGGQVRAYGHGFWIIERKADIYPNYKFALTYENQMRAGWVSEKIFDAMRCGCVPVYMGAPDIAAYVNKDCFIDRRDFEKIEDLGYYLVRMEESEHKKYLDAIGSYLQSKAFQRFLPPAFAATVLDAIER